MVIKMISYPHIDPVIVKIGPFSLRWYGLMYILGFVSSYVLVLYQVKRKTLKIERSQIDDLLFALILGLIIGARLGYVLFYNIGFYIQNPLEIFQVWHGGMSFHGGLIGTLIAGFIVVKRQGFDFFKIADLIIPTCPVGIGLGRIGNFINGELFGKPSTLPWAMVFPQGGQIPRHPSQLYEAFFEGLLLFVTLWLYKDRKKRDGDVFALFLMLYGLFRIFCEFFRAPDLQVGYIMGILTMGQLLSFLMILTGVFVKWYIASRRPLIQ